MSVHSRPLSSGKTRHVVRWREGDRNMSRAFDTPKAARAFDKEVRRLRQAGELTQELERRRITINDLYADWMTRSQPALSPKAAEVYGVQLDLRVLPAFATRRVAQISVADVERWIAQMRADRAGDPTIIKACTVLQALLSMAVRDGVVAVNVAQQARKPKQGRTRTPYLVRPGAVEHIRAVLAARGEPRDVVLLDLLAYAGLRPESEAITLPWRHVRDRSLIVQASKTGRERSVVLVGPLSESLEAWRAEQGDGAADGLVVPSRAGGAWEAEEWRRWHRRVFRPAAVAAGLPADVRPRDLRGSFASLLVHEGRTIVEVAAQLGHSAAMCLSTYAQVFDDADPSKRQPAGDTIRAARAAANTPAAGEAAALRVQRDALAVKVQGRRLREDTRAARRADLAAVEARLAELSDTAAIERKQVR